ncbi:MAG: hypothetical protein U0167_18045 [bacterium]
MRRTVLLALGVWMGTLPRAWADSEFAVSLSGSATDPWANHVSAVADSGFSVYLWLTCSVGPDALLNGMEGYILTDYTLRGFEELNGSHYVEYGPPEHFGVAPHGCPRAPYLLGRWLLANPQHRPSGAFCLAGGYAAPPPSVWTADCTGPVPHIDLGGVTGFAVGDSSFCAADNGCALATAVEGGSFGRTKANFRDDREERP